jgi:hypothetical protein
VAKPTKEERQEARTVMDAKVTTIHGKKIHWIPSALSIRIHEQKLKELGDLLQKGKTASERNTVRSEIRSTKEHLSRKTVPSGKKGWTTERIATKHAYVVVFISPKHHRYVLAERDHPADLLIIPAKKRSRVGMAVMRLQRFEKSPHAKQIKKHDQEDKEHTKRKKIKKAHRAKKRLQKK